ncbi:MAG: carboxylating nicotinate-nucleotide diphosphorylase [Candidatus Eisenbacteria bacterium]|nr:carboxylating nicotinate-nucleotide diphosphorylase [Candidatus Eisenbacteria bacterium]
MTTLDAGTLDLVRRALAEDVGAGDVTTDATVAAGAVGRAAIVAKAAGVIAGLDVAEAVFRELDGDIVFGARVAEGARVAAGAVVATVRGRARAILTGERTALNFLQRLSGIATAASRYAAALEGTGARLLDTRKTAPGMRALEKRAVALGGGANHRMGLWDMALVKDNHIAAAGGVARAVERVKAARPDLAVEVEVTTLDGLREALAAGADRVMLDNMSEADMRDAVRAARAAPRPPEIEISGGVSLENVRALASLRPDFISVGAVTHSAPALDLSLTLETEGSG